MEVLKVLFVVVEAICCLLLIVLILLQRSKNEGMGLAFGAGAGEALFGARAGNVLTKATVVLGIVFLVSTLVLGRLFSGNTKSKVDNYQSSVTSPLPVIPDSAQPEVTASIENI
jgi:preprotein translocase subunit SecG